MYVLTIHKSKCDLANWSHLHVMKCCIGNLTGGSASIFNNFARKNIRNYQRWSGAHIKFHKCLGEGYLGCVHLLVRTIFNLV
jgi:hypothetical protein